MSEALYRYGIKLKPKGNHQLQFRKPKLEIGTVATDWSPAPEDPDTELYERFEILQTDFSVVQGEIQAKVWETDIEKATDGLYESINEMYSYVNETVNSIVAEVGDLIYSFEGDYESLTAQVSDLIITSTEITTRVYNIEQFMSTSDSTNILLHTQSNDMELPYDGYNTEDKKLTRSTSSFSTGNDSTIKYGDNYIRLVNMTQYTDGNNVLCGCHWTSEQDIIKENIGKLVEGQVYTFSFYIIGEHRDTLRIWFDSMVYGQTVLGYSHEIVGKSTVFGNYGEFLTCEKNISSFEYAERVWVTFRLDNISNFRIGPMWAFGDPSASLCNVRVSGLLLNLGSSPATWNNGSEELGSAIATKELLYSEIEQLSDSITAKVVDLETDVNGQITGLYSEIEMLSDSITATVVDLSNDLYAQIQVLSNEISSTVADVNKDVSSQIQQLAKSISLKVTSATNGSASIVMTVEGEEAGSGTLYENGLRNAFANDTSAITISAGTITFNSNTFIVNSSYFSVTADGHITATAGLIGGWTIATNGLYSGPISISDTTEGIYMGPSGFRFNGDGISVSITDGEIDFYSYDDKVGYIRAYRENQNTSTYHLRIAMQSSSPENSLQIGGKNCLIQVYDDSGTVSSGAYCPTYTGIMDLSSMTYPRFRVVNGLVMQ